MKQIFLIPHYFLLLNLPLILVQHPPPLPLSAFHLFPLSLLLLLPVYLVFLSLPQILPLLSLAVTMFLMYLTCLLPLPLLLPLTTLLLLVSNLSLNP